LDDGLTERLVDHGAAEAAQLGALLGDAQRENEAADMYGMDQDVRFGGIEHGLEIGQGSARAGVSEYDGNPGTELPLIRVEPPSASTVGIAALAGGDPRITATSCISPGA
jgi:hypothetical protein